MHFESLWVEIKQALVVVKPENGLHDSFPESHDQSCKRLLHIRRLMAIFSLEFSLLLLLTHELVFLTANFNPINYIH